MKSSPWVAVDPPGPVRELNKAGVAELPLSNFQQMKFHGLLATGPRPPPSGLEQQRQLDYTNIFRAEISWRTGKYVFSSKQRVRACRLKKKLGICKDYDELQKQRELTKDEQIDFLKTELKYMQGKHNEVEKEYRAV